MWILREIQFTKYFIELYVAWDQTVVEVKGSLKVVQDRVDYPIYGIGNFSVLHYPIWGLARHDITLLRTTPANIFRSMVRLPAEWKRDRVERRGESDLGLFQLRDFKRMRLDSSDFG